MNLPPRRCAEIEVTVCGGELSKWATRHGSGVGRGLPASGIYLMGGSLGVLVEQAAPDVPYLDPGAYVVFAITAGALPDGIDHSDPVALAHEALVALADALGEIITRASKLEVLVRAAE